MPESPLWTWSLTLATDPVFVDLQGVPSEAGVDDLRAELLSGRLEIFALRVERFRSRLLVLGSVASEREKERILSVLRSFRLKIPVEEHIEVTAVFRSANRGYNLDHELENFLPGEPSPPPPALTSVLRYPAIRSTEEPKPEQSFSFEVDLAIERDPTTEGNGVTIEDVDTNWTMLRVDVEVAGDLTFELDEDKKTIQIFPDGRSVAARFMGKVKPRDALPGDGVLIIAVFSHDHRFSGFARRIFKLNASIVPIAQPRQPDAPDHSGSIAIVRGATPPDLTIKILRLGDQRTSFHWILDARRGAGLSPRRRSVEIDQGDTGSLALKLLKECPKLPPGQHANALRGIGETIWKTSPSEFRELYTNLRKKYGSRFPIQLITDEPHIPWEIMFPDDEAGVDQPDFLCMTHPFCRWFAPEEGRIQPSFRRGSIASFVPHYTDGTLLPAAKAEGEWLQTTLHADVMTATYQGLTEFWGVNCPDDPVAVLHFAGHGTATNGTAKLKLLDRWISSDEVNGGVRLGRKFGTLMIINACEIGSADYELGLIAGWAAQLSAQGFGGVLAPIWAVQDLQASKVVQDHLQAFMAGTSLGEALLKARTAYRDNSSTAFAYLCYGDVMACLEPAGT